MRTFLLLALSSASLAPPFIGVVRDCAGQPHRVYGMPGAFVVLSAERKQPAKDERLPRVELQPGWRASWPYLIRLRKDGKDGADIFRLPVPDCGGRP